MTKNELERCLSSIRLPTTRMTGCTRTGEFGRYLPDGNVEWAGRNDRRVNIRGFRVELAEVESVLSQHPAVKDAAVVCKRVPPRRPASISTHDLRLVAYVVPELDQPLSIDGLRSFLSARLPDYMVPSHFLILGRLPLTPNGKVDYQALPPCRAVSNGTKRLVRRAAQRPRSETMRNFLASPWNRAGWCKRQLLPSRRPFVAGRCRRQRASKRLLG